MIYSIAGDVFIFQQESASAQLCCCGSAACVSWSIGDRSVRDQRVVAIIMFLSFLVV